MFDIHFLIVLFGCFFLAWGIKNILDDPPEEDMADYIIIIVISVLILIGELIYSLRKILF